MDLNDILSRSKAVMEKTKNMPRNQENLRAKATQLFESDTQTIPQVNNTQAPVFSTVAAEKSKLPKEVIEAMRESFKDDTSNLSVLESVDANKIAKIGKREHLMENVKQPINTVANSSIDYSLIRMIVEESMKKYTSSLKKTLMTENVGSGLQLMTQKGSTFRFVTEDGKIFEGKLTYKGNINQAD